MTAQPSMISVRQIANTIIDRCTEPMLVRVQRLEHVDHLQRSAAPQHAQVVLVHVVEVVVRRRVHRRRLPARAHVQFVPVRLLILARTVAVVESTVVVFIIVLTEIVVILVHGREVNS